MKSGNFSILIIGLLVIGITVPNLAYGIDEQDNALASSVVKLLQHKEDMMNVWCAFMMECSEDIWGSIDRPIRNPDYVSFSDGEIFEKMILDSEIATQKIEAISLKYEDIHNDISLDDPKIQKDLEEIMNASTDVILELSPIVTELEFRGYTFHPMLLKDQKCFQTPYIELPEIKLPETDATRSELLNWSEKNIHKVTQHNKLSKWIYGDNFKNISSTSDRNELKNISKISNNFEESLVVFSDNPTLENYSQLQNTLKTIKENSKEYDDKFLLITLDVNKEHTEVIIKASIESGDYFESNIVTKCVGDDFSPFTNEQIRNVDATETQLAR